MDKKIIPEFAEEEKQKWHRRIFLGVGLLVLVSGFWLWLYEMKISNPAQTLSPQQQANKQKQQQQQALGQLLSQQGYPGTMPQDLIFNPLAQANTQVTTDKKTGSATTTIQYIENKPMNDVLVVYTQLLKNKGWSVDYTNTSKSQTIHISKGAIQGSISLAFADPNQTKVTIVYSNK